MEEATEGTLVTFARDRLLRQIEAAEARVCLASPFLTTAVARRIRGAADKSSAKERKLLTALVARSVQVGVLDPKALAELHEGEFAIASIPNLHAKVSLVDSSWGLVGSGNLTGAGLGGDEGGNVELGAILTPAQIFTASALFEDWWDRADEVSAETIEAYAALPRFPRRKTGPVEVGTDLDLPDSGGLDRILAEDEETAHSRQYWIKSNYHRHDEEDWWRRDWISDWRQAPYEVGDLIVLYLSARDNGPASCPAIVRVTSPSRHDRKWVLEHRDPAAADKWPYVTKTRVVAAIPVPLGIRLDVVGKSGQSVQGGYCGISRDQFERFARAMRQTPGVVSA